MKGKCMPIPYKLVQRANPSDRSLPQKFYAQSINKGRTDLRTLSNRIAQISTVSSVDTMACMEAFIQVVPDEMAEGNIIKMGEFGSFYLTLQSEGAETQDDFTSGNIKRYSIHFRPGKLFKAVLNNAGYKKE